MARYRDVALLMLDLAPASPSVARGLPARAPNIGPILLARQRYLVDHVAVALRVESPYRLQPLTDLNEDRVAARQHIGNHPTRPLDFLGLALVETDL